MSIVMDKTKSMRVGMFATKAFGSRILWVYHSGNKGVGMTFEGGTYNEATNDDYIIPTEIYVKRRSFL